ncbi:MAG: DUF427 domain-containing protein [Nitratireductor sp.]|nr:DUF427 domain-containing protein [Nitratireductor sp.]
MRIGKSVRMMAVEDMMFPQTNPAPGFKMHPDHAVETKLYRGTVRVSAGGEKLAETRFAVTVQETNHAPVFYIPIDDIEERYLTPSSHVTRCPFKGKARYWNLKIGEHEIDNAVWAYETPYDEVLELAGLAAFYPNKVTIETEPA